jgi:hypothetical protein
MIPLLVMQVAGLTAASTRFWFRLFEAHSSREGAGRPPRFPQNKRILVPEPVLSKLLQFGTVGEFWRTNLTDYPTQKGQKPVGSADRCPLADTIHTGICRGFVKGSISVYGGLRGLTFPVGRPSLKTRRSRMRATRNRSRRQTVVSKKRGDLRYRGRANVLRQWADRHRNQSSVHRARFSLGERLLRIVPLAQAQQRGLSVH